jgi:hypothetical protein
MGLEDLAKDPPEREGYRGKWLKSSNVEFADMGHKYVCWTVLDLTVRGSPRNCPTTPPPQFRLSRD